MRLTFEVTFTPYVIDGWPQELEDLCIAGVHPEELSEDLMYWLQELTHERLIEETFGRAKAALEDER